MGHSNMAARRAAKANRRKTIVAQKRKEAALAATPTGRVALGAAAPIRCCLLTEGLFDIGMGTLLLARGNEFGRLIVGGFLLDPFGLGIRDVALQQMTAAELDDYLDGMSAEIPMGPVDPGYARKLLRELAQWSASCGVRPHPDFVVTERLFGDVDPRTCETRFAFGRSAQPLPTGGAGEAPRLIVGDIDALSGDGGPAEVDDTAAVQQAAE